MTPSPNFLSRTSGDAPGRITTPELPGLAGAGFSSGFDSAFGFTDASTLGLVSLTGDAVSLAAPLSDAVSTRLRDLQIVDRLADSLTFRVGYTADLGRAFSATDVRGDPAFAGLFASPADFNATGFAQPGVSAGGSLALGGSVSLDLSGSASGPDRAFLLPVPAYPAGAESAFDRSGTQSILAGVDWHFAPWAGVALSASHHAVQTGAASLDALSLARSTNAVGASGHVSFGSGWVTTFSYNQGVTQLDLRPSANVLASNSLRGGAYGIAVAKHGLFGDDSFGLAVSRPLDSESGLFVGSAATDPFDGFIASNTHPILAGQAAETDLQLGYVTTFMDGALALQANAGYQMNAAGQSGNNGVAVLSRAKINF